MIGVVIVLLSFPPNLWDVKEKFAAFPIKRSKR